MATTGFRLHAFIIQPYGTRIIPSGVRALENKSVAALPSRAGELNRKLAPLEAAGLAACPDLEVDTTNLTRRSAKPGRHRVSLCTPRIDSARQGLSGPTYH